MRIVPRAVVMTVLLAGVLPLAAKDPVYTAPKAFHAKTYPAVDNHTDDKMAIAADPYDMPEKANGVLVVDYKKAGLLPIYVIFSNDGDKTINLMKMKVTLVTKNRTKIEPTTPDDIYRKIAQTRRPDAQGVQLPIPLPKRNRRSVSTAAEVEVENSGMLAKAIEPKSTHAGFMVFDVTGIENPLAGARLEITGLTDEDGKQLFFFEIPMEKYLGYQPPKMQ